MNDTSDKSRSRQSYKVHNEKFYKTNGNNNNNNNNNISQQHQKQHKQQQKQNVRQKEQEITAQCEEMCPPEESRMRIKNELVHALEKCNLKCVSLKIFQQ
jgi:hypothetical protein